MWQRRNSGVSMHGGIITVALLLCVQVMVVLAQPPVKREMWFQYGNYTSFQPVSIFPAVGGVGLPGPHMDATRWVGSDGRLWMFGGRTTSDLNSLTNNLNDLWAYNVTAKEWRYYYGTPNPSYGTVTYTDSVRQINGPGTIGSRWGHASWYHNNILYVFGGYGWSTPDKGQGYLSDMWTLDFATMQWSWVGGYTDPNVQGVSSNPGARRQAVCWKHPTNPELFYLYGGFGRDLTGSQGPLADMWVFNSTSLTWRAIVTFQVNYYGEYVNLPRYPAARYSALSWVGKDGLVWIYSGYSYTATNGWGYPADLWNYDVIRNNWTLVQNTRGYGGISASYPDYVGQYVTATDYVNGPGSRMDGLAWVNPDGNLKLYSGQNNGGFRNDVWIFDISRRQWKWAGGDWTSSNYEIPSGPDMKGYAEPRWSSLTWETKDRHWFMGGYTSSSINRNDMWVIKEKCEEPGFCNNGNCVDGVYGRNCTCPTAYSWNGFSCDLQCVNAVPGTANMSCVACDSGYYGDLCRQSLNNETCPPLSPSLTETVTLPEISEPDSGYINNTLVVTLLGPYVASRKYKSIAFVDQTDLRCSISGNVNGSTYWTKGVRDCNDIFVLSMPWSAHGACGFQPTASADPTKDVFSAMIAIEVYEDLGNFTNLATGRTYQEVYTIYVAFPNTLTITFEDLSVYSEGVQVNVGLTGERYDSTFKTLEIEFTTVVDWSYVVNSPFSVMYVPETMFVLGHMTIDNSQCTQVAGSVCIQKHVLTVMLYDANSCTFDGDFGINSTLSSCRDADADCATRQLDVEFTIAGGSVCADLRLNPIVTGHMNVFNSLDFAPEQANPPFNLGDAVYFHVDLTGTEGNTVSIQFVDITVNDNTIGAQDQYLLKNGTIQAKGEFADLNVTNSHFYFLIYLSGKVFTQPLGPSSTYTFNAKCKLHFQDNKKKRSLALPGMDDHDHSEEIIEAKYKLRIFNFDKNPEVIAEPQVQSPTTTHHKVGEATAPTGSHTIVYHQNTWELVTMIVVGVCVGTLATLLATTLSTKSNFFANVGAPRNQGAIFVSNGNAPADLSELQCMLQQSQAYRDQIDARLLSVVANVVATQQKLAEEIKQIKENKN